MYTLNWQPPYDWSWMFGFLAARAVRGVETVTEDYYERSFGYAGHQGVFRVTPDSATPTLAVSLSPGLIPVADICLDRISRLFDLDCDPLHIAQTLGELGAAGLTFARRDGCIRAGRARHSRATGERGDGGKTGVTGGGAVR